MEHAILKTRTWKPGWFRICWNRIDYACREANGSLKPVPAGSTREMLYCSHCRAEKCLFAAAKGILTLPPSNEDDGRKTAPARARAKGLAGNGRPLIPSCWNCEEIRCKLGGYVCRFESEADPVSQSTMQHRKVVDMGCNRFALRREMEIPPLDGDGADCGPL